MAKLLPTEVFTPSSLPVKETNVYAARTEAEESLDRALTRSEVPVVFGEYGVGKTTLIKKHFAEADRDGRLIHFLTPQDRKFDDVARLVLEALDYEVVVETTKGRGATIGGEAEASYFSVLKAKLKGEITESSSSRTELLVRTPTDHGLLNAMADAEIVLALDEVHTASEGFRRQLASMIKANNGLNRGWPKIVVIGTTADAAELVKEDQGIDRILREVRVNPMTDDEARFVVTNGMGKLDIHIATELVERMVRTAAGAPALLQEVCLDVAERTVKRETGEVSDEDIDYAVTTFIKTSERRLTQRYMEAIETVGPKRYRKQILRAMAESPSDFVTMEELTTSISKYLNETVPSTTLSGPLATLRTPEYGEILRDVPRPSQDGTRVYNLTAFKDPRMKAFIRVMVAVEEQGLLPKKGELS
ncbi:hypothetical protein SK069_14235 [Patulibacter brassicae]|uniref:Novel STAND NTPase 1 domain-containing protein n=1 Tax=Patulibacter brassicae TaxID=1705717 RepID=A0ABU4VN33_9ACTN|nr:AAA family ATPase [Patulibacter brassicae]MDX8152762.1 hypothetical protein [Patulibacter brassicae]